MQPGRIRAGLPALALALVLAGQGPMPAPAAEFDDPDWPCIQRKVPSLSIGQMWSGPMPEGDWRDTPAIGALARELAPRRTPLEEVEARAAEFAAGLDEDDRAEAQGELFAAILSRIDSERGQLIAGIGRYARNQTRLSDQIEGLQGELAALDAAPDTDPARIEELEEVLIWQARIFTERAQALTYVCETPVLLEQRAFAIARALSELL